MAEIDMSKAYNHAVWVDLDKPLRRENIGLVMGADDNHANRFSAALYRNGQSVDITGYSVTGYFIRPGDVTVVLDGVTSGNVAYVDLNESCYAYDGSFSLALKIVSADVTQTVLILDGRIARTRTDAVVDNENVIPSLEDLLEQISTIETAVSNAKAATTSANTAASSANTAASKANNAANEIENLEVTASTLPTGSNATASYADGVLTLGLPRGEKGEKGDTGSASPITVNGIEAVDDNITINGKNIPLSPFDSRSVEATVMERSRVENLLDNAWWGDSARIINQRGQSSYTGSMYTIDRWRTWSATATISITSSGLNTSTTLYQYLDIDPDKTYTAAVCKSDGTIVMVSGVPSTGISLSPITVVVGTNDLVAFTVTAGTYLWAALYEGDYTWSVLPTFVPKPYGAELMECQRYFRKIQGSARLAGFCTSTTAYLSLPLAVPMVGTPTITVSSYGTIRGNGNNITPTGASVTSANADSVNISVTYASTSGLSNHLCVWASPVFTLSADFNP